MEVCLWAFASFTLNFQTLLLLFPLSTGDNKASVEREREIERTKPKKFKKLLENLMNCISQSPLIDVGKNSALNRAWKVYENSKLFENDGLILLHLTFPWSRNKHASISPKKLKWCNSVSQSNVHPTLPMHTTRSYVWPAKFDV